VRRSARFSQCQVSPARAAEWLIERALSMPQEATVRVRLSHGRVAGVYALCAALGGVHYRTQPAILLAQFASAGSSPGIGDRADGAAQPGVERRLVAMPAGASDHRASCVARNSCSIASRRPRLRSAFFDDDSLCGLHSKQPARRCLVRPRL
jgi:hypothetical protein